MRRILALSTILFAACATAPPTAGRAPTEQEFAAAISVVSATCAIIPECQPKLCIRGACAVCTIDSAAGAGRCVLDVADTTCDGWWTRGSSGYACALTPHS